MISRLILLAFTMAFSSLVLKSQDSLKVFPHYSNGKLGVINSQGDTIFPYIFSNIEPFIKGRTWAVLDGKQMLIDQKGNYVIDEIFDYAEMFENGHSVVTKNDEHELLDINGNRLLDYKLSIPPWFSDSTDITSIIVGLKKGLINLNGEILPPIYDQVSTGLKTNPSTNRLAIVQKNEKYGLVNKKGVFLYPLEYERIFTVAKGLIVIYDGKSSSLIKKDGDVLIPFDKYEFIDKFIQDHAVVSNNEKHGIINSQGIEKIKLIYDDIKYNPEGFSKIKDKSIKIEGLLYNPENLFAVKVDDNWGFINIKDEIIVKPKFESVTRFSNGISIVSYNGKKGVINLTGEFIVEPTYREIKSTFDLHKVHAINYFVTYTDQLVGPVGLIDQNNNILLQQEYDKIDRSFLNNCFIINKGGKTGVFSIDKKKTIIPIEYDSIEKGIIKKLNADTKELVFLVSKDGEEYYIDSNNQKVILK